MNTATVVLIALVIGTYVLKAAGPLLLGGDRTLPPWVDRLATLLPAPLLAALVVTSTVTNGKDIVLDSRVFGIVATAIVLKFRGPFVVAVVAAAGATAIARAIGA